jgi:hypothetical protein
LIGELFDVVEEFDGKTTACGGGIGFCESGAEGLDGVFFCCLEGEDIFIRDVRIIFE